MTDLEFYEQRCGGNTIGNFVRAVLSIDNTEDAARFYRGCVAHVQDQIDQGEWQSSASAVQAANSNIGWCFGEGMAGERIGMWRSVCDAAHPIFGVMMPGSQTEAFMAGVRFGTEAGQ